MADMGFLPEVRAPARPRPRPTARRCCSRPRSTATSTCSCKRYQHNPVRHELAAEPSDERRRPPPVLERAERTERVDADRRARQRRLARPSCSAAPSAAPTASPSSSDAGRRRAPPPSTATARRASASAALAVVHRGQGRRRWSPPTSPPAASTSTASPASCTSTRRPTTRTTSTARAAPAGPGARGLVVSLVGGDQMADAKKMQRTLGLDPGIVEPDVAGLGEPAPPTARPQAPKRNQTVADIAAPAPGSFGRRRRSSQGQPPGCRWRRCRRQRQRVGPVALGLPPPAPPRRCPRGRAAPHRVGPGFRAPERAGCRSGGTGRRPVDPEHSGPRGPPGPGRHDGPRVVRRRPFRRRRRRRPPGPLVRGFPCSAPLRPFWAPMFGLWPRIGAKNAGGGRRVRPSGCETAGHG